MTGPQFGTRQAQPLEHMLAQAGGDGFAGLDQMLMPESRRDPLKPSDEVCRNLALLAGHAEGRQVIEWLMDITLRQSMGTGGSGIEEMALIAKQKQTLDGVAHALLGAIAHGETLINNRGKTK